MNIQFTVEHGEVPERPLDAEPQNIIVAGNFGGLQASAKSDADPAGQWNMSKIDLLDLDSAMQRLSPAAVLDVGGQSVTVEFHDIDDLHPDKLYRGIPAFSMISELKQSLANPGTFAAASKICESLLGLQPDAAAAGDKAPDAEAPKAAEETENDLFGRLLGGASHQQTGKDPRVTEALQRIMAEATVEGVVAESSSQSDELRAGLDAWCTAAMRELLQAPGFREIETSWRSLQWLAQQVELDEECSVWLVDTAGDDPASWAPALKPMALQKMDAADLVLVLQDFSDAPDSLAGLVAAGDAARSLGARMIAGAGPELAGVTTSPDPLRPLDASGVVDVPSDNWREIRRQAAANSIALGFGRFLLRQPYGERSDAIDVFDFDELGVAPGQEAFVWANAGVAVAALHLQRALQLEDLPMVTYDDGSGQAIMPVTGQFMAESASDRILANGPVPIVGHRGRTSLRVPRLQTIAEPPGAF